MTGDFGMLGLQSVLIDFNFWRKTSWAYYKSRGWALINSRHVRQDFVSLKNCVDHKSCASNYSLSSLFLGFLSLLFIQNNFVQILLLGSGISIALHWLQIHFFFHFYECVLLMLTDLKEGGPEVRDFYFINFHVFSVNLHQISFLTHAKVSQCRFFFDPC